MLQKQTYMCTLPEAGRTGANSGTGKGKFMAHIIKGESGTMLMELFAKNLRNKSCHRLHCTHKETLLKIQGKHLKGKVAEENISGSCLFEYGAK